MTSNRTKTLVQFSFFVAIIFLLAFSQIGFIQLGFIKATIIHIPVIIGSLVFGPKLGAGLGFFFGLTSLISNTFTPVVSSFAFSPFIPVPGTGEGSLLALIICFVPRILVGVVPYYVFKFLKKYIKRESNAIPYVVSGVVGSMTNTLLVMHLIYFMFKEAYATVQDVAPKFVYKIIAGIIAMNGIPEALVAGVITVGVCKVLESVLPNFNK